MRHWRVAWRRFVRPVAMAASAAAFVATLTLVPPASARSDRITAVATGSLWGYVWANQPATASYTPDPAFQKNSTGGTNTVHRTGRGRYEVRFPRLGAAQGTVDVTAYGSTDRYCKAASWSSAGTAQMVDVICYDGAGQRANSQFDAAYVRTTGRKRFRFGYVFANRPRAASYTPSLPRQYNSKGGLNHVTRTGTGSYTVHLPGLQTGGGNVKVTPVGSGPNTCKVKTWNRNVANTAELVHVRCFTAYTGALDP